jgi:hypothetical protein
MAVALLGSTTTFMTYEDQRGARISSGLLNITTIQVGTNVVAHVLPIAPRAVILEKAAAGLTATITSYDDTNVTFESNGGGAATLSLHYEYVR